LAKRFACQHASTVDHGTEFTSRALDFWAWENKVQLDFTRPGKPTDNGLCESFNGRLRDECLNTHEFESLEQAKRIIEAWRRDYNDHRPHGSLGKLTPSEYGKSNQVRLPEAARF
jgi:putative transposase